MLKWSIVCRCGFLVALSITLTTPAGAANPDGGLNEVLNRENKELGIPLKPAPIVNDFAYLRRVTVDLIGRIPTEEEIQEYQAWPSATRRDQVVEKLLASDRFSDRWTTFFADMLRLRSNAEGGSTLIAFVHKSVAEGMPYDELCRRLIAAGGKSGAVPEVGFILSDNADPLALAGITSQVFLGVRMACAECHDHPFDKWTRKDFYGLAAYFGKTRRVQRRFQNRILATYTTEVDDTTVLWPPQGEGEDSERKPIPATFPITLVKDDGRLGYLQRFAAKRKNGQTLIAKAEKTEKKGEPSLDDLLNSAAKRAEKATSGTGDSGLGVIDEAKQDVKNINVKSTGYRPSDLRRELGQLVTSPRNRYFSRSFVNRIWKELVGVGFVEPIDDFSDGNDPHHAETLDYLADEFVASGFDLRQLIRLVVNSEAYQRDHAVGVDEATRLEMENAFIATPMRRMISETLYDSIVVAGHMTSVKHEAGKNMKIAWRATRVMKQPNPATPRATVKPTELVANKPKKEMRKPVAVAGSPYDLEKAIELDFEKLLKPNDPAVEVEKMMAKSAEEIEAERMLEQERRMQADYFDRYVRTEFDDNPSFSSSFRMASPAAPEHFLRVFGQPGRTELGDFRDSSASMRQQLMILNGRLTHEASRVGELEPLHGLLVGKKADLQAAIQLAYRELLTRNPTKDDLAAATEVINAAEDRLAGMADLRWVLLNSNEFRFLP